MSSNTRPWAVCLLMSAAWPAYAQSADAQLPDAAVPAATVAGEIIVTANRREERLKDVPLAISATSGLQLGRQNIVQLQSLRTIDPSVSYRVSTGSGSSAFAIRGIGTSSFSSGIEQSVSTILDGVVLGDPSALQTLFDVERIEILRGPQGMLFGKNASSGVVNIVTVKPKMNNTSLDVRAQYGENNEFIVQAVANVPITDRLAVRIAGVHNHLDGWIYSQALKQDLNPINIDGISVKALWEVGEKSSLYLTTDYNYTNSFCCQQVVRTVPNPTSAVAVANGRYGIVPGPENFDTAVDAPGAGFGKIFGASLTGDTKLGELGWTTILGYRRSDRQNLYDADFVDYDYVNVNGGKTLNENYSAETRITSPSGVAVEYVAGLFYFRQRNDGVIGNIGRFAFPVSGNTLSPTAVKQTSGSQAIVTSSSYAAFGQATWYATSTLELTLGARYTLDRGQLNYRSGPLLDVSLPLFLGYPAAGFAQNGYVGFDGPYVTPCVRVAVAPAQPNCFPEIVQHNRADNLSYRGIIKNRFSDSFMAYVSHARGYKGPGFSGLSIGPAQIVQDQIDQRVAPEIPTAWEVGAKGDFFDRRLSFSLAIFHTRYQNFQAQVSQPTPNGFISRIQNAGEVTTKGIEFQGSARPFEFATLDVGATYLHARFGDFPGVACYTVNTALAPTVYQPGCDRAAGNTVNVRGNKVDNAPTFQYYIRTSYERPDAVGSLTGLFAADWSYRSSVFFSATNNPLTFQPGYGLLGGQIGVGAADNSWRFLVYGSNILNKVWAANISASPVPTLNPGGSIQFFSPDSFRHFGVKLEARF